MLSVASGAELDENDEIVAGGPVITTCCGATRAIKVLDIKVNFKDEGSTGGSSSVCHGSTSSTDGQEGDVKEATTTNAETDDDLFGLGFQPEVSKGSEDSEDTGSKQPQECAKQDAPAPVDAAMEEGVSSITTSLWVCPDKASMRINFVGQQI